MGKKKIIIDLFAGAGGESCGIHQAFQEKNEGIRLYAVNHWDRACETHALNYPSDEVICQDIQTLIPTDLVSPKEDVELMWASPECTSHSRAKGSKPLDDQSRCTPFDILRWATMLRIKRIIIENVPEFTEWGPLGKDLRPIKRERGSYFASFVQMLRGIGYDVDWRICCAADFGAPTTRRRLFIQAVKKGSGKAIKWPMPTNSRTVEDDLLGMEMKPWIPASSIIDWSIPCTPVDDRATPLAPKTMERILKGIARHWGSAAAPFLERYGRAVSSMDEPKHPSPLITEFYGTGGCRSIGEPLSTISCSGAHHGLVQLQPSWNRDMQGALCARDSGELQARLQDAPAGGACKSAVIPRLVPLHRHQDGGRQADRQRGLPCDGEGARKLNHPGPGLRSRSGLSS